MELIPRTDGEQELVLEDRDEIDLARFALHASADRLLIRPRLRAEMVHAAAIMAGALRARNSQDKGMYPDSLTLAPDETKLTIDALQRIAGDSSAPVDLVEDVKTSLQSLEKRGEEALDS